MAKTRWRTRHRLRLVAAFLMIHVVYGHDEDLYKISQLSPRSVDNQLPPGVVLQTSHLENLDINLEPSVNFGEKYDDADSIDPEDIILEEEHDKHVIVARSADVNDREQRSINIDDIPIANNNEIDSELELHNKRKYYDILPTKTLGLNYLYTTDNDILKSEGFGDRLDFKFPGEGLRAPKPRALHSGSQIRATAVQQVFPTASPSDEGRQNTEIQNIITGIVKLLNGNVNVQANSQLLRPGRPMASRINNRGPPRISDVPPLPDFDKPITPPSLAFYPTKTPPPYPFDRPPHHGVNLPEQIVPPMSHRPGFHRPIPPWQRPRPRPPNRRPNPGLPVYKPKPPNQGLPNLPDVEENKPDDEIIGENETHSENNIHNDEKEHLHVTNLPEVNTTDTETPEITQEGETTVSVTTTNSSSSTEPKTTTEQPPTTTEKKKLTTVKETTTSTTSTTTEKKNLAPVKDTTTEIPSTTEKLKPEKPIKTEKKKESIDKEKQDKIKIDKEKTKPLDDKLTNKTTNSIQNITEAIDTIQSSKVEASPGTFYIATPTPTEGLLSYAPTIDLKKTEDVLKTSSINTQPVPTSDIPYHPYRPRPGIVLDDPDFKPTRQSEVAVITADPRPRPQGYGEIFDVTVSAIQGPGEKGGSVHIATVHAGAGEDDIIVTPSGEQGFVSIDGKRTYLNLFDTATHTSVRPTRVQSVAHSAPPPPLAPHGSALPVPEEAVRRPARPNHGYRKPQPTVRIDTCIVGDDSTCDQAQNEMCRTEAGISSCQCRPGYARRAVRHIPIPCRRVVALLLSLRVDRLYDRKVAWDNKLADKDSEPYQQLSYEAVRAIDSAFSMTPFSDDFVSSSVNSVHQGEQDNRGVFINYTVLMQETPETLRAAIGTDIQKHVLGVIRRRSNNVGASALWVDTPAGAVLPLKDVDECASPDLNDCHQLAVCTNTWGGFRCACPDTTLDPRAGELSLAGRHCQACPAAACSERGVCRYYHGQPHCSCSSGYYGSTCEVDGEVVGVAVGASLAAALVIALTLAALLSWSRKWSREQKAMGMGSPVFSYMTANTVKTPPVGQPPYQVTLEERMRWAQIAEAMAQANHYAPEVQAMATRPSSAMFGGYPTLPPVPMPRMALHSGVHTGTLNTVTSRANTSASHHNLYGYTNHLATDSTSSEASSHAQDRADLLVPRPKSRARSMHNQTGIYYDVEYENTPEAIYGTKGIPLSTYTVSRGPPFYRS